MGSALSFPFCLRRYISTPLWLCSQPHWCASMSSETACWDHDPWPFSTRTQLSVVSILPRCHLSFEMVQMLSPPPWKTLHLSGINLELVSSPFSLYHLQFGHHSPQDSLTHLLVPKPLFPLRGWEEREYFEKKKILHSYNFHYSVWL